MANRKLHKSILILLLVLTPPYFLMFTDEGARISDNVILWLFGKERADLNLKELDPGYTREEMLTVFPDLEWDCREQPVGFGDNLCAAEIGAFNDYPSQSLTLYFRGNRISAVKVLYRDDYHEQVVGHLIQQFGQPLNVEDAMNASPDPELVLEWDTGRGLVLVKKDLQGTDEPSLVWLARLE